MYWLYRILSELPDPVYDPPRNDSLSRIIGLIAFVAIILAICVIVVNIQPAKHKD